MSPPLAVVLVACAGLVAFVIVLAARARTKHDGMDSFRRQIDALSPEARRAVVEQVNQASDTGGDADGEVAEPGAVGEPGEPPATEDVSSEPGDDGEPDGGARGA